MKFANLYKQTKEDVELSLLSLWAPGHHRMRPAIKSLFQREPLMAEPVFQSLFPWELTSDPNWPSYLNQQVITKLRIGVAAGGNEPRQLQTDSWRELNNGNSIVVTSGTGSGKTECFLYPVLSDLYSQKRKDGNDPVGALFLYPLNALMQDQKDRLGKDCKELGLKFAVYNSSLKVNEATYRSSYPGAEVMTRERVRRYDNRDNASCPQILLTNPSMLEYMLVRDKDQSIFERSRGALRWIVIDEAHTYTGSAAVELAYLIKRVLQAFDVTRDQVRFVCTSATIGDPHKPQELIDFITSIIGKYSSPTVGKLIPIDGKRMVSSLSPATIQNELNVQGISQTTGAQVDKLRDHLNKHPMTLSSIWKMLTGKTFADADTGNALNLLDRLCDIKIGNDYILMARGHFFIRNIEGLYACVNTQCTCQNDFSNLGFKYLTSYRADGKCPHCGAPLLELVQCSNCQEFMLACEENENREIRPTYNDRWSNASDRNEYSENEKADNDVDDETDGGTTIEEGDDTWEKLYLAYYDDSRKYAKPHPNYMESRIGFKWDGNVLSSDNNITPWVMLQNEENQLYCPTCAKGSGKDGREFKRFRSSSNWLNGVLAPSLLKETAPAGTEWGKYIAFTDSRQGTAIYAKRFNIDAERAYARARIADDLSVPGANPNFTMNKTADCIFNKDIFDHIDYEISSKSTQHNKDIDGYKSALLRGIVGRRPVHVANLESLGLATLCYPTIDSIQNNNLPNICETKGIDLQDWKNFLKICLDYYVRMGNHLQCPTYEEKLYMREPNRSTPFSKDDWPSVKLDARGNVKLRQNRIVSLLCAGLGIHDVTSLQNSMDSVGRILDAAFEFLKSAVLSQVVDGDDYYDMKDKDGNSYNDRYYLDMSPGSDKCQLKLMEKAWICPVTNFLLDTIFKGYSPSITGCLCPENVSRFAIHSSKIPIPHLRSNNYNADVANFKTSGLWNNWCKYAFDGAKTGYLTAEHSGQQDRGVLDHYTKEFKATPHKLNLLQCSTTMEMGVDVGDIELVLMTNVPPTSANYMQRAGRAGRRGQSKACAFSICPNTAIGVNAFQNPTNSLTGTNPAIIPVESEIIVQRHANSFFVRQFLIAHPGVKFHKVYSWLNVNGAGEDYIDWLTQNLTTSSLQKEFAKIFGNTRNMYNYAQTSIQYLKDILKEYQNIYADFDNAIVFASNAGDQTKVDALSYQLIALEEQDLKGYLAENRFLPNANMPTGVVEFNHMDKDTATRFTEELNKKRQLETQCNAPGTPTGRKRNLENQIVIHKTIIDKILEHSTSSREIKIALSEYAPGQTVVINEKNYVSAGIETRNSFNQGTPYKYLYHCEICGRYDYTANSNLTNCPNCNGVLRNVLFRNNQQPYTIAIEPVRFRTDVNKDASRTERTEKTFFDIQTILTNVNWKNPSEGPLCEIVGNIDADGEIVFYNPGKGRGFSWCRDCDRMEETSTTRNSTNWPHMCVNKVSSNCPANNVTNNIVLAGKFPTSFVAMRFFEDSSYKRLVDDEDLLYSLGVLLCKALAKTIGVSRDDIDFDVRKEQGFSSIYIYDTCKGGCGYSTRMLDAHTCNMVFKEAKAMFSSFGCTCEKNVSGACVNCLLDRSSQRLERHLSKHKVMEWFASQTMNLTSSPLGTAIPTPLPFLAIQKVNDRNTQSITFCVDASDMRLAEWSQKIGKMGRIIDSAVSKGKSVEIVVANVPSVAREAKLEDLIPFVDLPQKFQNWGVKVTAVETLETRQGELSSLIINDRDHFFTVQPNVLPFTEDWGNMCTSLYENNSVPQFVKASFPTIQDVNALKQTDVFTRDYTHNGSINPIRMTVRDMFSHIIQGHLMEQGNENIIRTILSGQDVKISFSDSFVNSALASLMLVHLLRRFKEHFNFSISEINLRFKGNNRNCRNDYWNPNEYITFNFPNEDEADAYTRKLCIDELGIEPRFSSFTPDHCRWIRFEPMKGDRYVEFRPDHGIDGGWQSSSKYINLDLLDETTPVQSKRCNIVFYLLVKKK